MDGPFPVTICRTNKTGDFPRAAAWAAGVNPDHRLGDIEQRMVESLHAVTKAGMCQPRDQTLGGLGGLASKSQNLLRNCDLSNDINGLGVDQSGLHITLYIQDESVLYIYLTRWRSQNFLNFLRSQKVATEIPGGFPSRSMLAPFCFCLGRQQWVHTQRCPWRRVSWTNLRLEHSSTGCFLEWGIPKTIGFNTKMV